MKTASLRQLLLALVVATFAFGAQASADRNENIETLRQALATDAGVLMRVHGADNESRLYVGSYIVDDFFNAVEVSLLGSSREVREQLMTLGRHDTVRLWGSLMDIEGPQPHLRITRLEVVEKYESPAGEHQHDIDWEALRAEIQDKSELLVQVHISLAEGSLLVVEYKDYIFPIYTREFAPLAATVGRQDMIRIRFKIQESPGRPMHLELRGDAGGPAIEAVDHVPDQHGTRRKVEGTLLLFPQSPIVRFNVFAIKFDLGGGFFRTYTLINFEDPELFTRIREKLQALWDAGDEACVVNDRNKLSNPCVKLSAEGVINMVDPKQANPQVLLESTDDIVALP
jgi:hypothetical protein